MKIVKHLDKDLVRAELLSSTKQDALREMLQIAADSGLDFDIDAGLNVLTDREKLGTTGIGDGIAIPHGKLSDIDRVVLVAAKSSNGVEFDSLDGEKVTIFFLVISPENENSEHLKSLSAISRALKDKDFREKYRSCSTDECLWELLSNQ